MKDIIILGTGGNCIDILDTILALNEGPAGPCYRPRGFLDDNAGLWGQKLQGYEVLGPLTQAGRFPECVFVNGIGSPRNYWRKPEIIASLGMPPARFETLIHPCASVSRFAALGSGTVVLQNATINARARIGSHVIILPGAVISHDTVVGDFSCIAAGASIAGNVQIGTASYLGANCAVVNCIRMGQMSLVGAGAVVLKDIPEKTVVVGNPARVLRAAC
jgi:sugar O-acyltransferase (sialic acid O-acetyltransferase NeuD family)